MLFSCVACASRVAASAVTLSICFHSFSTLVWGKPVLLNRVNITPVIYISRLAVLSHTTTSDIRAANLFEKTKPFMIVFACFSQFCFQLKYFIHCSFDASH